MALTITDVFTTATEDQWFDKILSIAKTLGLKTTAWQPGGITRTILRIVAKLEAGGDQIVSVMAQGTFLKFAAAVTPDPSVKQADGTYPIGVGWLDVVSDSGYDEQRIGASYATGPMVISNASGATYGPFAPGTYHLANPTTKKGYHNTASLTISPSGDTTAPFAADESGADSTSAAASITQTVTSLVGVSVNPVKQAGTLTGANAESNSALVTRCLNKLAALGPKLGPTGAYAYFATTATVDTSLGGGGLTLAGGPITRVKVTTDPSSGAVTVTIANAAGAPSGPDVTAIDGYLHSVCVPDSITEVTQAASETVVTPTVDVWVPAQYNTAAFVALVQATVGNYINGLPIGGIIVDVANHDGVPLDGVVDSVFNAGGSSATATFVSQAIVLLNGAASDVLLAATAVAKCGTVTVNVHTT